MAQGLTLRVRVAQYGLFALLMLCLTLSGLVRVGKGPNLDWFWTSDHYVEFGMVEAVKDGRFWCYVPGSHPGEVLSDHFQPYNGNPLFTALPVLGLAKLMGASADRPPAENFATIHATSAAVRILSLLAMILTVYACARLLAKGLQGGVAELAAFLVLCNPWVTAYGHMLYFGGPLPYLPFLAAAAILAGPGALRYRRLLAAAAATGLVALNAARGGEYLTTIFLMALLPFLEQMLDRRLALRSGLALAFGMGVAAALCLLIVKLLHVAAFACGTGISFNDAVPGIMANVAKSVNWFGDAPVELERNYVLAREFTYVETFLLYLKDGYEVWFAAALCLAALILVGRLPPARDAERRVAILSLAALVPPISWMVLGKGHAVTHSFYNGMLLNLPFTLYASVLVSQVLLSRSRSPASARG